MDTLLSSHSKTNRLLQLRHMLGGGQEKLNILVYGAGVLGSLCAARLHQAGHTVSILARGQRNIDLRQHGVVLENALTGELDTIFVSVVDQLNVDDAYDLVMVIMRKNQVLPILPTLAANQHTPTIAFLGNNAAGSDVYVQALGRERVLLGFVLAGGLRKGNVISYLARPNGSLPIVLGEIDGSLSPRLRKIAAAFKSAKLRVRLSANIDAWLKTHVALVSPLANAIYAAGGDTHRLAHTRDGIVMGIRAVREGFEVLSTLGIPITPFSLRVMMNLPEPLLIGRLCGLLDTKSAEIVMAGHANAARDEMCQLADEFKALIQLSGLSTPSIDYLYSFVDPKVPPIPEGSGKVGVDWRSAAVAVEAFAALVAIRRLLKHRWFGTGHAVAKH